MPITYGFLNYTKDGPESPDLEKKMDEVVDRWSAVAQLEFIRASDPKDADIKISFGPKRHLDCKEIFDGPGGVLAHAYFPTREIGPMGGDMHFDEDETWDLDFFYQVALHEMGHSLGLDHSDVKEAVMDGFFDRKNELHDDDIRRIQELYGAK
jgi:matrix metalloproteinase-7 (matrilysin)